MNNTGFLIALVATVALIGTAALSRYVGHFRIGERIAARRAAYKIEHATADQAFSDPLLRSLIACPACGAAGDFDVIGKKQCQCRQCGTAWDAA